MASISRASILEQLHHSVRRADASTSLSRSDHPSLSSSLLFALTPPLLFALPPLSAFQIMIDALAARGNGAADAAEERGAAAASSAATQLESLLSRSDALVKKLALALADKTFTKPVPLNLSLTERALYENELRKLLLVKCDDRAAVNGAMVAFFDAMEITRAGFGLTVACNLHVRQKDLTPASPEAIAWLSGVSELLTSTTSGASSMLVTATKCVVEATDDHAVGRSGADVSARVITFCYANDERTHRFTFFLFSPGFFSAHRELRL